MARPWGTVFMQLLTNFRYTAGGGMKNVMLAISRIRLFLTQKTALVVGLPAALWMALLLTIHLRLVPGTTTPNIA